MHELYATEWQANFAALADGQVATIAQDACANQCKATATDELLGVKAPKVERIHDDDEARRTWKRFQTVATLPERDQKAVIRLIVSNP
jgi:hypothetical protein